MSISSCTDSLKVNQQGQVNPVLTAVTTIAVSILCGCVLSTSFFDPYTNFFSKELFWSNYTIAVGMVTVVVTYFHYKMNQAEKQSVSSAATKSLPEEAEDNVSGPVAQQEDQAEKSSSEKRFVENPHLNLKVHPFEEPSIFCSPPPQEGEVSFNNLPVEVIIKIMEKGDGASLLALSATCKTNRDCTQTLLQKHIKASVENGAITCWEQYVLLEEEEECQNLGKDFIETVRKLAPYHKFMLHRIEELLPYIHSLPQPCNALCKIAFTFRGIFTVHPELIPSKSIDEFQQRVLLIWKQGKITEIEKNKILKPCLYPCSDLPSAFRLLKEIRYIDLMNHLPVILHVAPLLWKDFKETLKQLNYVGIVHKKCVLLTLMITGQKKTREEKEKLIAYTISRLESNSLSDIVAHLVPLYLSLEEFDKALELTNKVSENHLRTVFYAISRALKQTPSDTEAQLLFDALLPHLRVGLKEIDKSIVCNILGKISDREQAKQMMLGLPFAYLRDLKLWNWVDSKEAYKLAKESSDLIQEVETLWLLGCTIRSYPQPYTTEVKDFFSEVFESAFTAFIQLMQLDCRTDSLVDKVVQTATEYVHLDRERAAQFFTKTLQELNQFHLEIGFLSTSNKSFCKTIQLFRPFYAAFLNTATEEEDKSIATQWFERAWDHFQQMTPEESSDVWNTILIEMAHIAQLYASINPERARDILLGLRKGSESIPLNFSSMQSIMQAAIAIREKQYFNFSIIGNWISLLECARLFAHIGSTMCSGKKRSVIKMNGFKVVPPPLLN